MGCLENIKWNNYETLKNNTFFISLCFSLNASAAWDGVVSGGIGTIDVTAGENYGFRLTLKGVPKLCGNSHNWAYLNESDSNYKTFVSVLLAARMSKSPVFVYTNKEKLSGNDYCHIGYIGLR